MQQPRITAADVDRFVEYLDRRDRKAAARQVLGLLEAGVAAQDLVPVAGVELGDERLVLDHPPAGAVILKTAEDHVRVAQRRVADAHLPVLGIHRFNKTLGQRDRRGPRFIAAAFQPHGCQRDSRRKHRESPIYVVGDLSLDKPVRPPCLADQRLEQRGAAVRIRR